MSLSFGRLAFLPVCTIDSERLEVGTDLVDRLVVQHATPRGHGVRKASRVSSFLDRFDIRPESAIEHPQVCRAATARRLTVCSGSMAEMASVVVPVLALLDCFWISGVG